MTFNMAYSAIRIEKNKAIIQSAIVMAFLYPNSSLFLYVQIMLSNFFFMLGMPSRMLKTTNPNTRRSDMPYTIDCATSRLVQPCKSSIKPFRRLPVPLHIDIKPSQREIKKLATPVLPTNTPVWSLSHIPVTHIQNIPKIDIDDPANVTTLFTFFSASSFMSCTIVSAILLAF